MAIYFAMIIVVPYLAIRDCWRFYRRQPVIAGRLYALVGFTGYWGAFFASHDSARHGLVGVLYAYEGLLFVVMVFEMLKIAYGIYIWLGQAFNHLGGPQQQNNVLIQHYHEAEGRAR